MFPSLDAIQIIIGLVVTHLANGHLKPYFCSYTCLNPSSPLSLDPQLLHPIVNCIVFVILSLRLVYLPRTVQCYLLCLCFTLKNILTYLLTYLLT